MKIKYVQAEQFKGRSHRYDLTGVDLFLGPSFSGKTAVLDSVRVGLLGYHPKLGKRPAATFALATGPKMGIELGFDGCGNPGTILRREWETKKGAVKYAGPEGEQVPAVLLDVREYFAMSGADRLKYIFERMTVDEADLSPAAVTAAIKRVKVEDPSPASEEAIAKAVSLVEDLAQARESETDISVQLWLDTCLTDLKTQQKEAKEAAKQIEGLLQGASQIKAQDAGRTAGGNPDKEIAEARAQRSALTVELDRLRAGSEAHARYCEKLDRLLKLAKGLPDYEGEIKTQEGKADDLAKRLSQYKPGNLTKAATDQTKAAGDVAALKLEAARLGNQWKALDEAHRKNLALKSCPFCKSSRTGWREHLVDEYTDAVNKISNAVVDNAKLTEAASEVLRKAESVFKAADKEATKAIELRRDAERVRVEVDRLRKTMRDNAAVVNEAKVLTANPVPAIDEGRAEESRVRLTEVDHQIAQLELRQKQFIAGQQEDLQKMKAKKTFTEQAAKRDVFALAIETVRALQQETIDKAIGSLMGTARQFTDGILPGKLEYRDGEIGFYAGPQWVSHEVFSGTEEALAYAGLAVALAQESETKVVIIDELGIADLETKAKIVKRMAELHKSGVIDNCILADVSGADYGEGVTVHKIER